MAAYRVSSQENTSHRALHAMHSIIAVVSLNECLQHKIQKQMAAVTVMGNKNCIKSWENKIPMVIVTDIQKSVNKRISTSPNSSILAA